MSGPEANRRRYPRYDVDGVRGSFVVPTPVQVVNLSLGGMAVETYRYLERLLLPPEAWLALTTW